MDDRLDTSEAASPTEPDGEGAPALVNLLIDQRGLPDKLSGQTVPEYLMTGPIGLSVQWLHLHGRECRARTCSHTPGPLRRLLKFQEKAIAEQHQLIHRALWDHPDSPMVQAIRDRIVVIDDDLARVLDEQAARDVFHEYVDADALGLPRFAAVLWARGLEDPDERQLFRLLPLFGRYESSGEVLKESPKQEVPEKDRLKRKRKEAEKNVKELTAEIQALTSKARERKKRIETLERDLERAQEGGAAAQRRSNELQEALQVSEENVRNSQREARETDKAAKKSGRLVSELRGALADAEGRLEQSESEQATFRRQLALAQAESEQLGAELRSVPRGKDAVAAFLATEEEEIDLDILSKEGADERRARTRHALHRKLESAFLEAYPEFKAPRPAHTLGLRSIHFHALGGGAEVGRSSYLLEIGSSRVLVDCGIAVGRQPTEMAPDIGDIGPLDAVVLTHAHTDHLGWLPVLIKQQKNDLPIYCSEETFSIAPIMLRDAHANYERRLAEERLVASQDPDAEEVVEDYTDEDRKSVEARLRLLRWEDPSDITGGLKLRIFRSGHILGAASVLIEGGNRRVVMSGDISSERQKTVWPARPPSDLGDVDFLVLESTYGDRNTDAGQASRDELVDFVRRATEKGTALLPCFALGRSQEVLRILLDAKDAKEIDQEVMVFVDGLIRKIIPTYVEKECLPEHGYQQIRNPQERAMAIADCERSGTRAVVVSTSGMLSGGPIIEWARHLLSNPRHRLALLGYQDGESAGGRLRKLNAQGRPPYRVSLRGEEGELIEVQITNPVAEIGLSAHADQRGLVEYSRAISPKSIALVHGEPPKQAVLKRSSKRSCLGRRSHVRGQNESKSYEALDRGASGASKGSRAH